MRKGIIIAFGLLVVFGSVACFAQEITAQQEYNYYLRNDASTALDTLIPVTSIRPNVDKLVGYDCQTLASDGGNTETYIVIFDAIDVIMSGECLGEKESNARESISVHCARGKRILNGIHVRQGAFTEAHIRFIRK